MIRKTMKTGFKKLAGIGMATRNFAERTSVNITPETKRKLKILAEYKQMKVQELAELIISQYLEGEIKRLGLEPLFPANTNQER